MEKQAITEQLKSMKTVEELADLLNAIKQSEFRTVRYSISEKMLKHFSSDSIAPKRFRTFHIRKKSGGLREIKAPCRQLDVILTCVNELLKTIYEPSDAAMGFTTGRSVLSNAQIHVGHNYVFNIDLTNFFPSIPQARVWKRLQLPPFNFTEDIANVLSGLCCTYDEATKRNVLPQGSPASPLLTNAICDKLDRRMKGVAKRFGLHYSRYADDMTFSSMHNVYQEGGMFRTEISRIIREQGFQMNDSKTRLQKAGARQEVTGLTVNAIANVSRQYISDLRWILNVWEKEGYAKAYALFYPKYKHDKGYIKKGEPVMENVIGGKLDYLRMVRGANNPVYMKLAARFEALQGPLFEDNETDTTKSYIYVQPYTLAEFQTLFHTTISLEISREGKVVGKCEIDGKEKYLSISKSTQKIICPGHNEKGAAESIHSDTLKECYVTLCRSRGKNFWLITKFEPKRSRCMSVQNLKISPEELLSLWERDGFEKAAQDLAMFIQYGDSGKTILDFQPPTDTKSNIDRGAIKSGEEYLLWYFIRNQHLTTSQKRRFIKLLKPKILKGLGMSIYKSGKRVNQDISIEKLRKKHNPQSTAEFLSLFGAPSGLKFLTHDFDPESDQRISNIIDQSLELISNYKLPQSLYALINGFIRGPKWLDFTGKEHTFHLSSETMKEWSSKYPTLHPITSSEFGSEVQCFRNTVRLCKPDFPIKINALIERNKLLQSLHIQTDRLDKADFYTNVTKLFQIIRRVLFDIQKRETSAEVHITYDRSTWNEYRLHQIRIVHKGSEANPLEMVQDKLRSGGGDMFELAKLCIGYCDWSIEANFEGKMKRWRILDSRDLPEEEEIRENDIAGFTHTFTFYKYR